MKAYTYTPSGELIAQVICDENPLVPGEYLLPARATFTAPPTAPAGKHPRWRGLAWELISAPVKTPETP